METDEDIGKKCRNLLMELQDNSRRLRDIDNDELNDLIRKCNELFKEIKDPKNLAIDTKIVLTICILAKQQAFQLHSNIFQFFIKDYADNIRRSINVESDQRMTKGKLIMLGKTVKKMMKRSPYLNYLNGALGVSEPETTVKKQRQRRVQTNVNLKETIAESDTKVKEINESTTDLKVMNLLRYLVEIYRKNGEQPVNFWSLVIKKDSFSDSVENLFYASFLVKECKVGIGMDEDEEPAIWPLKESEVSNAENTNRFWNHVVVRFSVNIWKSLVLKLNSE